MAKSLEFWFDYTCPYAYLGSTQIRAFARRMGRELVYRPILLGGIFKANEQPQKLFASRSPSRIAYDAKDMQRWATLRGVPLNMPAAHPLRSVEALRATLATNMDPAVIDGFYRAYWVDNREISSREVIAEVVTKAGHDAAKVLAAIETQEIKDDLRARTERGIALGIFGVPTIIVDGELYWGQDRFEQIFANHAQKELEVFWDFSSPFAYLGATQVEALAKRTGAKVKWTPILLGGLFKSLGGPEVPLATFPASKQRWVAKDLERWAKYWDVPYKFPSRFPTISLKALRLYLALPESHKSRYRENVFRVYWSEDKDITDEAVLVECVGDAEVAAAAVAKMNSDEIKSELRMSTERAAKLGVFGVPTFAVGGELYWGQDRLALVEDALRG
jgi:2-hydroxychromene-2-carboxylate isomerase